MPAVRTSRKRSDMSHLTPDYLIAKDAKYTGQSVGRQYAQATETTLAEVEKIWQRYCAFMSIDAAEELQHATSESFRRHLTWRVESSDITRLSSIYVYWKNLRLLHRRRTGHKLDDQIGEDTFGFINGPLQQEYNLDQSTKSKPVMGVDDLLVLLHHHWITDTIRLPHERQRVQLPLLLLMIAYTASRPGALVESGCARRTNEALYYGDVRLLVIRDPEAFDHNLIVIEVSLLFMKGQRGKSRPTIYLFHERDDNLGLCPVLHLLALAFADDAFEAEGIKQPEDIFRLKIEAPRNSLHLRWKHEIQKTPIFRQSIASTGGVVISHEKALTYDTVIKEFRNLGRSAGFSEIVTPYCIRRGSANAVDSVATVAERNQVLGHSRSSIFEKYYLAQRVKRDVQSAFLGCPARDALISSVGRMSLSRDPRAPTKLSADDLIAIRNDPRIFDMRQRRQELKSQIKAKNRLIRDAAGSELHNQYSQLNKELTRELQRLRSSRLEEIRETFFKQIDTAEIQKQLGNGTSLDAVTTKSQSWHRVVHQRTYLAAALFRHPSRPMERLEQLRQLRIEAMKRLIELCNLQTPFRPPKTCIQGTYKSTQAHESDQSEILPYSCSETQCLFCLCNHTLPQTTRRFSFARIDHLRKHVQQVHLRHLLPGNPIICPHPDCSLTCENVGHFKNHAATAHNMWL